MTIDQPCLFDSLAHGPTSQVRRPTQVQLSATLLSPDVVSFNNLFPPPKVDPKIVAKQSQIFKMSWPSLTPQARKKFPKFADLYDSVKIFNLPNFLGAKKIVPSGLNIIQWENELTNYHDKEICFFLKFGWPVGYHLEKPPVSVQQNHPSATMHASHVHNYIRTELAHNAIVGPFSETPFAPWTRLSPLMTRPKRESEARRVIADMSFPNGEAVNNGINISSIYGRDTTYTLPSIKDLATLIQQASPLAWIWKADLARAYRQLRVDPINAPLLGFAIDSSTYIDLCPSFGCRSSSGACQRVSAAVVYIMSKKGFNILAFLDDFAGCEASYHKATLAYHTFLELTQQLGLQLAKDKCQPPANHMQWLGYEVNCKDMSIAIPADRMLQVLNECKLWTNKTRASRTMIQSLIGKLVHLANCVRHARKFTARMLETLRAMGAQNREWTTLNQGFKADISWFLAYSEQANVISIIAPVKDFIYLECDSSLEGGGGNSDRHFFKWKYMDQHKKKYPSIHMLEAINLLVSYRTLCPKEGTAGKCIVLIMDNLASHFALNSGQTKDQTLSACARELWLEAARADHEIRIEHKPGTEILLADALSRFYSDPSKGALALKLTARLGLTEIPPKLSGYTFFNEI